jgi:hypothetical protein
LSQPPFCTPINTIGTLHLGKDSLDVHRQGCIAESAMWLVRANIHSLSQSVLMIAAGADLQNTALHHDRLGGTMSLGKGISHRDSFAKYTAVFLDGVTVPVLAR